MRQWKVYCAGLSALLFAASCDNSEHPPPQEKVQVPVVNTVSGYEENREVLDSMFWHREVLAQHFEKTMIAFWDGIRNNRDKFQRVQALQPESYSFPATIEFEAAESWPSNVMLAHGSKQKQELTQEQFATFLRDLERDDVEFVQSEYHHHLLDYRDGDTVSTFSFKVQVRNVPVDGKRYDVGLSGMMDVTWKHRSSADAPSEARVVDITSLKAAFRDKPQFTDVAMPVLSSAVTGRTHLPVVVTDINGDQKPEILMPNANDVLSMNPDGSLSPSVLFENPSVHDVQSAVVSDVNGDGMKDLVLGVNRKSMASSGPVSTHLLGDHGAIVVHLGTPDGSFDPAENIVFRQDSLFIPTCLSVADIDMDGDADIFVGQYKPPYANGQMPTPFYDANDGYPMFILRNDGDLTFKDATVDMGITTKRWRRVYSASIAHLNEDDIPDLLVVSDFAGIDMYKGTENGFVDITSELSGNRHSFGMSHIIADFDNDAREDVYVVGMSSTTARRLQKMGLGIEGFEDIQDNRMNMAYGNRMMLGGKNFDEPPYKDQVARSGWSWGSTDIDIDNDGWRDIFIVNGHVSRTSASDYCTHFWRDDIYRGKSEEHTGMSSVYRHVFQSMDQSGMSWNGFEKNVLFLNNKGQKYTNAGFPLGLADVEDSRCAAKGDMNLDGKMDLFTTTTRYQMKDSAHLYMNNGQVGDWYGLIIDIPNPELTRMYVENEDGTKRVFQYVNGSSFNSQHWNAIVAGEGESPVTKITVKGSFGSVEVPVNKNQYTRLSELL